MFLSSIRPSFPFACRYGVYFLLDEFTGLPICVVVYKNMLSFLADKLLGLYVHRIHGLIVILYIL